MLALDSLAAEAALERVDGAVGDLVVLEALFLRESFAAGWAGEGTFLGVGRSVVVENKPV